MIRLKLQFSKYTQAFFNTHACSVRLQYRPSPFAAVLVWVQCIFLTTRGHYDTSLTILLCNHRPQLLPSRMEDMQEWGKLCPWPTYLEKRDPQSFSWFQDWRPIRCLWWKAMRSFIFPASLPAANMLCSHHMRIVGSLASSSSWTALRLLLNWIIAFCTGIIFLCVLVAEGISRFLLQSQTALGC